MTDGWNLQSNVKNKRNAQGTLFSGGRSQMPDAKRYKKGYNPERQRAVNDAVQVYDTTKDWSKGDKNTGATRAARETIKRSSVPIADLHRLRVTIADKASPLVAGGLDAAHGYYEPHGKDSWPAGDITLAAQAHQPTLLHEIGHHASALAGTPHSAYNTPHSRGSEEGFADRYMDDHAPNWSLKTGSPDRFSAGYRRGTASYQPQSWQALDKRSGARRYDHFEAGYGQQRPMETRTPNNTDRWRAQGDAQTHERARKHDNEPQLPGMDAASRLGRTGPWEGVKPS